MCYKKDAVKTKEDTKHNQNNESTMPTTTSSSPTGREAPNPKIYPHIIQNDDDMWLKWTEWWPRSVAAADIKGCLFLVSGLGEHAMRYDGYAEEVAESLQFAVFSLDHQGHGLSEGPRKYVDKFGYYTRDYLQFLMTVFAKYSASSAIKVDISAKPRFLLGHSMGGLIALHVARACAKGLIPEKFRRLLFPSSSAEAEGAAASSSSSSSALLTDKHQLFFNGVVYSGPAIKPDPAVATPTKQTLARWLANWAPTMGLGNLEITEICNNTQVVEYSRNDVLFAKEPLRARWGYEMLLAMGEVEQQPKSFLNFPFLVIHGEKDTLTLPAASEEFFKAAVEVADKRYILYKGKRHEILNEVGCEEVRADVRAFFEAHMGNAPRDTVVVDIADPAVEKK